MLTRRSWLAPLGLTLALACFKPVQEVDGNGQAGETSGASDAGIPDAGTPACGPACGSDAGHPVDAGAEADAGPASPDSGSPATDSGLPDSGTSCVPGTLGCWNQGCPDGGPLPGGYCSPCHTWCDCGLGPNGEAGECFATPTGQWCTWGCVPFSGAWCAGQSRCVQYYPNDQGYACIPFTGDGGCH